jgi:hypothetical protein
VIVKLEKLENSISNINSVIFEVIFNIPDLIAHFNLDGITVEIIVVSIVFSGMPAFEIVCISIFKFFTVIEIQLIRRNTRDILFTKEMS